MSLQFGDYTFEGPFETIENIDDRPGVYMVLCSSKDGKFSVLDIGEAGWGHPDGSGLLWRDRRSKGAGVKTRLKNHNRKKCWEDHCAGGSLLFAVRYENDDRERLKIEEELRRILNPPCGEDWWNEAG
jgi:hypothetical protein